MAKRNGPYLIATREEGREFRLLVDRELNKPCIKAVFLAIMVSLASKETITLLDIHLSCPQLFCEHHTCAKYAGETEE